MHHHGRILPSILTICLALGCPPPNDPKDPDATTGDGEASTIGLSAEESGAALTSTSVGETNDASTSITSNGDASTTSDSTAGQSSSTNATTGATMCAPGPGEALGPCRPTRDDQCDGDLLCLTTADGSICQPTCADCSAGEHDACIADLGDEGFTCEAGQGCLLPCDGDAGCHDGTMCSVFANGDNPQIHYCVWPRPEAPPDPACQALPAARCPTVASTFCWAVVQAMQDIMSGGLSETLDLCESGDMSACEVCAEARQRCEWSSISVTSCAALESTCLCLADAFDAP